MNKGSKATKNYWKYIKRYARKNKISVKEARRLVKTFPPFEVAFRKEIKWGKKFERKLDIFIKKAGKELKELKRRKAIRKYWRDVKYISRKQKTSIKKTRSNIKGMTKIERTGLRKSLITHRKKPVPIKYKPGEKFETTRAYIEGIDLVGSDPVNVPVEFIQWIDSRLDNVEKEIKGKIYYHFVMMVDHPIKDIMPKEKPMFEVDKFSYVQMLFIIIHTYINMFHIWQVPMDSEIELGIEPL